VFHTLKNKFSDQVGQVPLPDALFSDKVTLLVRPPLENCSLAIDESYLFVKSYRHDTDEDGSTS